MVRWARIADGWAVNLDGSDAAAVVSFPRLELRSGAGGWECACLLADGTTLRVASKAGARQEAQHQLVERAREVLGPQWAGALAALRAAR